MTKVILTSLLPLLLIWAEARASILPLRCVLPLATQGRLLALAAKKGASEAAQIAAFVAAYQGILEDSQEFISLPSLTAAYESATPFAVQGEGALFLQTQEALLILEQALKRLPKSTRQKVELKLHESLRKYGSQEQTTKRRGLDARTKKTGIGPPFSVVYELPEAFSENATAGQYTSDGKYLITLNSQGRIQTYSAGDSRRQLVYSTAPLSPDGSGFDAAEPSLKTSPLVIRPGNKEFAFLIHGSSENAGPYLVDVASGRVVKEFQKARRLGTALPNAWKGERLTFSPDGSALGIGGTSEGYFQTIEAIWDLKNNFVPFGRLAHLEGGASSGFSLDGRFYFSALGDFHTFDLKDGYEILSPLPRGMEEDDRDSLRSDRSYSVEFAPHPSAPLIAIQDFQNDSVRVGFYDYSSLPASYSAKQAEIEQTYSENENFGPRRIRYRKSALKMTLFHTQKKKQWAQSHQWSEAAANGLLFSPDGKFLVSHAIDRARKMQCYNYQISVPDASLVVFKTDDLSKPGRIHQDLSRHITWRLSKMRFTSDGSHLLVLDYWGRLSAFRVPDFQLVAKVGGKHAPIWDFEISPDSHRVFTIEGMGKPMERNFLPE